MSKFAIYLIAITFLCVPMAFAGHEEGEDQGDREVTDSPYTCLINGKDDFQVPKGQGNQTVASRKAGDLTVELARSANTITLEVKKGKETIAGASTREGFPIAQRVGDTVVSCNPTKGALVKSCEGAVATATKEIGLGGISVKESLKPSDTVDLLKYDPAQRGATMQLIQHSPREPLPVVEVLKGIPAKYHKPFLDYVQALVAQNPKLSPKDFGIATTSLDESVSALPEKYKAPARLYFLRLIQAGQNPLSFGIDPRSVPKE